MNYARVSHVLSPVREDETVFFKTFETYLSRRNVAITVLEPGESFSLGSASVEVLGPVDRTTPYTNGLKVPPDVLSERGPDGRGQEGNFHRHPGRAHRQRL